MTPLYIVAEGKIVANFNGIRASLPIALILLMGLYYIFRVEFQLGPKIFIFLEAVLQNIAEARKRVAVQKFLEKL